MGLNGPKFQSSGYENLDQTVKGLKDWSQRENLKSLMSNNSIFDLVSFLHIRQLNSREPDVQYHQLKILGAQKIKLMFTGAHSIQFHQDAKELQLCFWISIEFINAH